MNGDVLKEIFNEYNFEGWNAIDIMLIVSDEINNRFFNVSPSFTIMLSKAFPDIFDEHMQMRSDFIYEKIKINIEKGMEQGMYKEGYFKRDDRPDVYRQTKRYS